MLRSHGLRICSPLLTYQVKRLELYRSLSWNPFVKRVVADAPPPEAPVDEVVVNASQELRNREISAQRLKEIVVELSEVDEPGKRCFGLMNDAIRKLSNGHLDHGVKSGGELNGLDDQIIPMFDTSETIDLYNRVIDNVDRQNFESARFIPRLYLQLLHHLQKINDHQRLTDVFVKFVQYLIVLGYPEQLNTLITAFIKENPGLADQSYKQVNSLVDALGDDKVDAALLIKVYDAYKGNVPSVNSLKSNVFRVIKRELKSINEDIFSVDVVGLETYLKFLTNIELVNLKDAIKVLDCLSINDSETFVVAKGRVTSDIISQLINSKKISMKLTNAVKLINYLIDVPSSIINPNERLLAGSVLIDSLKDKLDPIVLAQWDVFQNGRLTEDTLATLKTIDIDTDTYNKLLIALINSDSQTSTLQQKLDDFNKYFNEEQPVDKNLKTYEILITKHIHDLNFIQLQETLDQSLDDYIDWESNPKILFRLLSTISADVDTPAYEVYQIYKQVKQHTEFLTSASLAHLVEKLLTEDSIGTILKLFKTELPTLPVDEISQQKQKLQTSNYQELHDTIFNWILSGACNTPDDARLLWSEMLDLFEIPYSSYFPLIKRFLELDRPDVSLNLFHNLKTIHKTTGRLPPPTTKMYTYLFNQFGRILYLEGVEELHTMLKLDLDINTDIHLLNSILNAYANLNQFQQVSHIFDQIKFIPQSKAGLNNYTVSIMLKTYTFYHIDYVTDFWHNLDRYNVLPDSDNLRQLVVAYCYHGDYKAAFQLVQVAEDVWDVKVTKGVLQSLYQWTEDEKLKSEIEDWASLNYPKVWPLVEKSRGDEQALVNLEEGVDETQPVVSVKDLRLMRGL